MKKSIIKKGICLLISTSILTSASVFASGVSYLPNVTKEMSQSDYWTNDNEKLLSFDEIQRLNELNVSEKGTNMYDLKNQAEFVDGISLNEALLKSSKADAKYYSGWTYSDGKKMISEEDFSEFTENTQNPNAQREQAVRYGIAVKRTALRAFPTDKEIGDDPSDKDFDYQYLSAVRINEPLVITSVSADGKYYLAKSICCSGWVPYEDVAICADKAEWLGAWDISPEKSLIVYGDRVYTQFSNTSAQTSNVMLTMGTVLEKADITNPNELIDNRAAYQNYAVWMPFRGEDGSYGKKLALISEHNKVSDGYLELTEKNILNVAFSALGNTYGWGGSLMSDDCSGYVRNIYKCFGLELARNTTWQADMKMSKLDMQYMCREEREDLLDKLPVGAVLYFKGHEMLYLGKENGSYYVVSSISSIMQPENSSVRQRIRSIVINTLDIKRANGNSWLDDLTLALIPYQSEENSNLSYKWYHDGVAYCLKNKLVQGNERGFFNPGNNITFAEILQILSNAESDFADDKSIGDGSAWYDKAATWAKDSGLINENNEEWNLQSPMTRQQLAYVFYLYAQHKGIYKNIDADMASYTDLSDVSDYALSAVKYAFGSGLMNGKSENAINPNDNTTRAEAAVILERFGNLEYLGVEN